jgi:hypothetical protein
MNLRSNLKACFGNCALNGGNSEVAKSVFSTLS